MPEGRIIKALSGFYYVESDGLVYQCRGRGLFRKNKVTPLVGDYVIFEKSNPGEGSVVEILPRKNELVRPPISNIDQAVIVASVLKPEFSSLLLDRFLVLIESKKIEPVIFFTKMDTAGKEKKQEISKYVEIYRELGYVVETISTKSPEELNKSVVHFEKKVSVIAGQSGVGKSSLLNTINPNLKLETNEISNSLGRGKHTTRHVELIQINDGLVADTPGFSSLDFNEVEAEQLQECFPEIRERANDCKFRGCMHKKEPKCAVKRAVETEEIASFRYEHYLLFLDEIQQRKPRY